LEREAHIQLRRSADEGSWGRTLLVANPPVGRRVLEELARSLSIPLYHERRAAGADASTRDESLSPAYRACAEIIKHHSKSFYFSSSLLPVTKRHDIMALYAFCRTSDDLVDAAGSSPEKQAEASALLAEWAAAVSSTDPEQLTRPDSCTDQSRVSVARAWGHTRHRYGIPTDLADELLAGVRMDLSINRYETWDDLWLYCYRVASTVGLMSMYIMGTQTMDAVPYAVQLGVALQLTNILRDVGEDAQAGRIYLPAEDMEHFGYTEEMLLSGVINSNFIALMDFQIARADALYASAQPGIALLSPDSRMAVTAAATLYRGILRKIVAARYNVFNRRAHLSTHEKLRALPGIWWRSRRIRVTAG
jgi:phytoene synthase